MKKLFPILLFTLAWMYSSAQAPGGVSSGLSVWLKADAGTSSTSNGASLDYWNDQSSNGYNATQSSAAAKPQFLTGMMNGNPVVRTTASKYFAIDLSAINNHNHTIFTVTLRQSGGNFQHIIGVQEPGAYVGLNLGYSGSTLIRYFQYGNIVPLGCPAYNASTELPTVLSGQFDISTGKKVWNLRDGSQSSWTSTNKTQTSFTAQGRIGRGNDSYGFTGLIAEVIVYNRVLTDAEKRQIHTYLSVKYGLSIPGSESAYYNQPSYANDVFGIGRDMASQGLNQTVSNSAGLDDILELRDASSLSDGDYLICGNDNGATSFSAYAGANCSISTTLGRKWKFKRVNDPGTNTLRFDLTSVTGFTASELVLLMDTDGDGFDDETPIAGTYSAPYFDITGVTVTDGAIVTIGTAKQNWYAVTSGNASGAIWASTPNGTPQTLTSFCAYSNLTVNAGVTVTNNWASISCKNFTVALGGIFNASSNALTISGDMQIDGTFNAQSSTLTLNGTSAQTIRGNGYANAYNLTVNNSAGVTISATSGGVLARNLVTVSAGTLTTNSKLTLVSDASSTGMINSLTTGSISGNVTAQRYHNAVAQGWVNLACPIQSKTIQDWNDDLITTGFSGSDYPPPYAFNNVQYYNESASGGINTGFVGVTNVTNSIPTGRGYFVFMNSGVMNLDVDGQINSGNISLPITYTNTGNPAGDGWNMVGNPYPCTIDWNSASWTKTNISNAVYVWNAALGQYASYVSGVATNGGSRYIPSSQSFFVIANAASPNLTIAENCKSTNQGTFKSTEVVHQAMTLHISNDLYSDETTLSINESGSLHFDHDLDAYKLRSPLTEVPYMSTISQDGDDLSVNTFGEMTNETIIPLRIEVGMDGIYKLSHIGLSSFANGACIVLEDLLHNVSYALNSNDEIDLDLYAGTQDLRFQLRIGGTKLIATTTSGCPGVENGTAQVFVDANSTADITWTNSEGTVISKTKNATGMDEVVHLASGWYTVEIGNNGVCGTTTTEFFIEQDEPLFSNAVIAPASCQNAKDGAIALNILGGSGPYSVVWSNGSTSNGAENLEAGDYTAFVTDQKGCSANFSFQIPVNSKLVSSFETIQDSYELMNGAVEVNFYNTSSNSDKFFWTFGDATRTSQESNPSHLFNAKGVYEVTLTAADDNCESYSKKTIKITSPVADGNGFSSEMIGTLTDNGVQIMFYFDQPRNLRILAYNVLGQQLIEPINGVYERQTITFSDRRYAANALIEVIDLNTGERALMRMGM